MSGDRAELQAESLSLSCHVSHKWYAKTSYITSDCLGLAQKNDCLGLLSLIQDKIALYYRFGKY